ASNVRAWRNISTGLFLNDDIKLSRRLTLTLGLRYDLYTRHTEKYGQATQLVLPAGSNLTNRVRAVNCYVDVSGAKGDNGQPCNGGFEAISGALTTGDHNNFGPRVGFAWDVFGDGKTALRGGFGTSYNGEVYNPLSNSRWDPPFYSFELAFCGTGNAVGAGNTDSCIFGPQNGAAPTYKGPPSNIGSGPAATTDNAFAGNIQGWNPYNANPAFLTGVVFPGFRDPYVFGTHLSVERQLPGNSVLKVSWVGTFGHKLYRSEDINRVFGGVDSQSGSGPSSSGECSLFGPYRVNCLFGRLRTWENSVNSNYNGLQVVFEKRMSHGLEWHSNYVWSHSLDGRSTWHSGATTANGAEEGFSMDQAIPGLDYGNSTFDARNSFTNSFVWQMPWLQSQRGLVGHVLGGWSLNNIITWRAGFPWTPYCSDSSFPSSTCDYNRDGVSNDRPNAIPSVGNRASNSRSAFEGGAGHLNASAFLACSVSPGPKCENYAGPFDGKLGRNTFLGPTFADIDLSLFKNIKATERVNIQFRAEAFNLANRVNLYMPNMRLGQSAGLFDLSSQAFPARQIQFALKMIF
ncbi:MAG: TonB-dependent receptor, partial [Acidobacteriota bacterium]|nr:TonB-dependent receptor [Acidobacteriota bacterium]